MKLLLDSELVYIRDFDPDITQDELEDQSDEFDYILGILHQYNIHHRSIGDFDRFELYIPIQKVTLDEFDMNNLFYNVLCNFSNIKIRYASLGGNGCDFALRMYQNGV